MLVLTQTLKDAAANGHVDDLKHCRLLYDSITRGASITVSTAATNFPGASLANGLTYELWKATALPATAAVVNTNSLPINACGIAAHTLGTDDATVTVQRSDDDGTTWHDVADATPETDEPILFLFATYNDGDWRIRVTGSTVPTIGVWYLGEALPVMRKFFSGHQPINLARKTTVRPQMSEGGHFIGRSKIRQGNVSQIALSNLKHGWYRRRFDDFVESAILRAFFVAWRPTPLTSESLLLDFANQDYGSTHAEDGETPDVGYVWTRDDIRPSFSGTLDWLEVSFNIEGLADG